MDKEKSDYIVKFTVAAISQCALYAIKQGCNKEQFIESCANIWEAASKFDPETLEHILAEKMRRDMETFGAKVVYE